MNPTLLDELYKKLGELIKDKVLCGKEVVLFGMNTPGDKVIDYLKRNDVFVAAIIDNNRLNNNKRMSGVQVFDPYEYLKEYRENVVVLICSKYFSQMKEQLEMMGYRNEINIIKLLNMDGHYNKTLDQKDFNDLLDSVKEDYSIYKKVVFEKLENDFDCKIILLPVRANGDCYIMCKWLYPFIQREKKNNSNWKYKVLVIGNACKNIVKLFEKYDVEAISQREADALVNIYLLFGIEANIYPMQPYYLHTRVIAYIEGINNMSFEDYFKYVLMKNNDSDEPLYPKIEFGKKCDNRMVIISPYANSLPNIDWDLFEKLADYFISLGYNVFTNAVGENETVIKNTERLSIPFAEMIKTVNNCSYFISVRSGLCDVLEEADCNRIIIYPDKSTRFSSIKEYFGLKKNEKLYEIVFQNTEDTFRDICEHVRK